MRVLHLYSDYRWTGPAEPVVNQVLALRSRGVDVLFACRADPLKRPRQITTMAGPRGVEPITTFHLNRYGNPLHQLHDYRRLPRFLDEQQIDILHTHLSHDHILGGLAARQARRPITVVRTNHKGVPLKVSTPGQWLLRRITDGYVGFNPQAAQVDLAMLRLDESRMATIQPALDLDRFDPTVVRKDIRAELGLGPQHILAGVVARVQGHRRWQALLDAMAIVKRREPNLRLLIIGRGSSLDEVARQPAKRMGLDDGVIFTGYRKEDYVDYVQGLDFKVFLMPGSDGTCRAAREAMALGKPVLASNRGMLPLIVPHEVCGLVIDDTPENLADAMVRLAQDPALRQRLGSAARQHALDHFLLERQAQIVHELYQSLLAQTSPRQVDSHAVAT
jgi:glycosyltransferase involved in cell wall biosynthesis